jgi:hypothetical protein
MGTTTVLEFGIELLEGVLVETNEFDGLKTACGFIPAKFT